MLKPTHRANLGLRINLLFTNKAYLAKLEFLHFGIFSVFLYCCSNKIKGTHGKLVLSTMRKSHKNRHMSISVQRAPFQAWVTLAVHNCGSLSTKGAGDCILQSLCIYGSPREICRSASVHRSAGRGSLRHYAEERILYFWVASSIYIWSGCPAFTSGMTTQPDKILTYSKELSL
jgi:hypothetical protein